ncbi:MAG: 30S ribosomal protein S8 [Thermoplasmata archaeon]|jgi:small subunit ribosomal protein S8|nr:30S ribosomal protein S8 [Thermoplasmata archaeon]
MQNDPLSDALSKIKNSVNVGKLEVEIRPASKLIGKVLKIMQDYNYVKDFEYLDNNRGGVFRVRLHPSINSCGSIKPRFSVKRDDIEKFEARYLPAQDFGILIISTNRGLMTHSEAKKNGLGGKLIAYVY